MADSDPLAAFPPDVIRQLENVIDRSIAHQIDAIFPTDFSDYIEKVKEIKTLSAEAVVRRVADFQKRYGLALPEEAKAWDTEEFKTWLAKQVQDPRLQEIDQRLEREHRIFADTANLNCTAYGNGLRFIHWYGDDVRYCGPFEWWFVWTLEEGRWARDELGRVSEMGKDVVLKLYQEAARATQPKRREELAKWAIRCETPGSVSQLLESARTDPRVAVHFDIFDNDPLLLNLRNGYLDLRTMQFHLHDKSKFFSMMIPFDYDPKAKCPQWIAFLDRIFRGHADKEAMIEFLQRAIGYTLTGEISERAVFLLHGLGANGKSVFIRVLEAMFGDYGATVSSTTFTTAMANNVRNDYARLKGKRFVWASENSTTTTLDEEMIKRVSGGDMIACRFLYQEEFTYRPVFKIWWVFNHKPKIRDATDSLWDRIHLIPCEERIPPEEQDKRIAVKLETELPGILNWALEGLKKYRESGLKSPKSVVEATAEYRRSEDVLADFLEETFETEQATIEGFGNDSRMPFKTIYALYTEYCSKNNLKLRSKQWLGRQLESRYKKYRTSSEKGFLGLRVKQVSST